MQTELAGCETHPTKMNKHIAIVLSKYPTALCRDYGVGAICILAPGIRGLSYSHTERGAWAKAAKVVKAEG